MQSLKLQQTPEKNALVVIENTLKLLNIKISKTSLDMVQYLPSFPSLATLTSTFNELGIETLPARLAAEQLFEISFPAIAHLHQNGGTFVTLTALSNNQVTYHNPESGWITEGLDKFIPRWSGVILLLEPTVQAGDRNYAINRKKEVLQTWRRWMMAGMISLLVLGSFILSASVTDLIAKVLFIAGAACSALMIASEMGSQITKSFCQAGKKIDCHSVLNSPAATLFGWLKMSEVGLVWFTGSWLVCLLGNLTGHVSSVMGTLFIFNSLALLYVPFSISYQGIELKRWCTLCLTVQAILVVNAIVLSRYYKSLPDIFSDPVALYCLSGGFITVTLLWIWMKPAISSAQQLPYRQQELYRIKRNPELFKLLLSGARRVDTLQLPNEVRLGPENAPIQLTMVTNPYCEPCMKAHGQLAPLVQQMNDQLAITFRFSTNFNDPHDKGKIFAQHFLSLASNQHANALDDWHRLKNYETWSALYPVQVSAEAESTLREHQIWNDWAHINKTPTLFMNGYELPDQYGLDDVIYHIRNFEIEVVTQN